MLRLHLGADPPGWEHQMHVKQMLKYLYIIKFFRVSKSLQPSSKFENSQQHIFENQFFPQIFNINSCASPDAMT